MGIQDFRDRDREFTVVAVDQPTGDMAEVRGRALLGQEAATARKALSKDPGVNAVIAVLKMACPDLSDMGSSDVEHVFNRTGGMSGGLGDAFYLALGQSRDKLLSEVGGEETDPIS